jgi:hypothetical protein
MAEEASMGDLEGSLRYPFTGEGWGPKFALGGLLYILGNLLGFIPWVGWIFCLLISFLPLGYAYLSFRDHLRGPGGPLPAWTEWEGLFRHGFFVFLISLGYGIIPGLVYRLGKALWESGGFAAFWGVLFLIVGLGVGLVAFFFLPMALAFYAREEETLSSAFRWSGIVEKIWLVQKEYFVGWLSSLAFFLVLLFVEAYFLYVGWILYSLGLFYLSLAASHFFGRICRASMEATR